MLVLVLVDINHKSNDILLSQIPPHRFCYGASHYWALGFKKAPIEDIMMNRFKSFQFNVMAFMSQC
jgi:hypothetical protein